MTGVMDKFNISYDIIAVIYDTLNLAIERENKRSRSAAWFIYLPHAEILLVRSGHDFLSARRAL